MSVKVERDTGWIGMGSRLTLVVNGEKKEKIKHNDTIDLSIDESEVTLQAKQFGVKTNEITVKDHDHVKIVATRWSTLFYIGLILLFLSLNLIESVLLILVAFILSIVLLISMFIPGRHYRLEHVNDIQHE